MQDGHRSIIKAVSYTHLLPEAQVDRFMLQVVIDYPKLEDEKLIIRQNINGEKFNVKPCLIYTSVSKCAKGLFIVSLRLVSGE